MSGEDDKKLITSFISVPPLWKDSLSLENIANDFLDSNVTGEVMKLDDFLKELQSSDVQVNETH